MNRLALVGETVRHALNRLAVVAPDWLRAQIPTSWGERSSGRLENARLPRAATEREALASAVLGRIWLQQYYAPDDTGAVRWRQPQELPPPERWSHSPDEVEARFSLKRGMSWVGDKTHLTETCDEETPHLVTQVETTAATTQDDAVTAVIQDELATQHRLPAIHLVDAGDTTASHLVSSRADHGIDLVGPVAARTGWRRPARALSSGTSRLTGPPRPSPARRAGRARRGRRS